MHLNELPAVFGTVRTGVVTTVAGVAMSGAAAFAKAFGDAHDAVNQIVATVPPVGWSLTPSDILGVLGTLGTMAGAAVTFAMTKRHEVAKAKNEIERDRREMERESRQKDHEIEVQAKFDDIRLAIARLELTRAEADAASEANPMPRPSRRPDIGSEPLPPRVAPSPAAAVALIGASAPAATAEASGTLPADPTTTPTSPTSGPAGPGTS